MSIIDIANKLDNASDVAASYVEARDNNVWSLLKQATFEHDKWLADARNAEVIEGWDNAVYVMESGLVTIKLLTCGGTLWVAYSMIFGHIVNEYRFEAPNTQEAIKKATSDAVTAFDELLKSVYAIKLKVE